jgi:hypothetical protein
MRSETRIAWANAGGDTLDGGELSDQKPCWEVLWVKGFEDGLLAKPVAMRATGQIHDSRRFKP